MLPSPNGHQPGIMTKGIDEIPLNNRKNICTEIDFSIVQRNGYWDRLVSELGFTESDSKSFQLAFAKSQSPAENLLRECSYRNYRIGTLCSILKRIGLVKLAEENLDNLGERHVPPISHLQWPGAMGGGANPRRPTESDSTNSSHSGSDGDKIGGLDTIHYPYHEIVKGTSNFSSEMKLGAGAFGKVYKVNLKNTIFACKVLTINTDSPHFSIVWKHKEQSDLKNELRYLAEYRHPNIIPLYGWSLDGKDPCLIYQYMKNGSLQDCLQRSKGNKPLSWLTRIKVSCDAARGLQFLHEAKDKPLIHGDIKTANILLDDSFVAKLGDFGLAREGPRSHVTGSYVKLNDEHTPGTMGYLAVEYMQSKKLSVQVDTYAFGVVLLELYTGRRAYDRTQKKAGTLLRDYMDDIANGLGDGGPGEAEDRLFEHQSPEIERLPRDLAMRFVKLSLECCHEKRNKRPAMSGVLERLESLCNAVVKLQQGSPSGTASSISQSGVRECNVDRLNWPGLHWKPTESRTPVESVDFSLAQPTKNHRSYDDQSNDIFLTPREQTPNDTRNLHHDSTNNREFSPQMHPSLYEAYLPTQHHYVHGIYPHHMMAVNHPSNAPMQWVTNTTGAGFVSPMFPLAPPSIPHQMAPYPAFPSCSQFPQNRYLGPNRNLSNAMLPSSDSDDSSGPRKSQASTPLSPSTPGMLSTPEAFSSLELDQPGVSPPGLSPQPQYPTGNANGSFPQAQPNLRLLQSNPFYYPRSHVAYTNSSQRIGSHCSPDQKQVDRDNTAVSMSGSPVHPTPIPLKVNPVKADMLEKLRKLDVGTDSPNTDDFLSEIFHK